MAGELTSSARAPWNPLACPGRTMRPHALLMAKLAFVLLLTDGLAAHLGAPLAPVIGGLEALGAVPFLGVALKGAFLAAGASLLLNRAPRTAAFVAGTLALYAAAASAPAYGSHVVFSGMLLVLLGLQARGAQPALARVLVIVTLAVSAIGKALDPGWTSGALAGDWLSSGLAHPLFTRLHALLPGHGLALGIAWSFLAAEAAIAALLVFPQARRLALGCLAAYLLVDEIVLAAPEMTALAIAVGVGCLSFLDWPAGSISVLWPRACGYPLWLRIALDRYDWDGRFEWPLPPDPDAVLEVEMDGRHFRGPRALATVLLHFPALLMASFAVLWLTHLLLPAPVTAIVHLVVAGPVLAAGAFRRLRLPGGRRRR